MVTIRAFPAVGYSGQDTPKINAGFGADSSGGDADVGDRPVDLTQRTGGSRWVADGDDTDPLVPGELMATVNDEDVWGVVTAGVAVINEVGNPFARLVDAMASATGDGAHTVIQHMATNEDPFWC